MDNMYFLIDITDVDIAATRAALASVAAGKYSGSPVIVERPASHDSNLVVVKLPITEAELDANSNLVKLRLANYPNAACRTRWENLASFRLRGFHVLNQSIRSNEGIAGRAHYWVRRKTRQATGTGAGPGYGAGNGLTYYDARDGLDVAAQGATWASAATHTLCGVHLRQRVLVATAPNATEDMAPFPVGDFSANPLIWRMDYEYDPGMFCGDLQDWDFDGVGGNRAWSQDGTNPNVWLRDLGSYTAGRAMFLADPTKATQSLRTQNWLVEVLSLNDCRNTNYSYFADITNDKIYINTAGYGSPRFRIGSTKPNGGWGFAGKIHDLVTRSKGFKFINCQFVYTRQSSGSALLPESEYLGGRYLVGSTWKPTNGLGPTTKLGWSTDGRILYDTSDRPDPATDEYINILKTYHGSDPASWDRMRAFLEVDVGSEGFYEFGGGFTDKTGFIMQGVLMQHIGDYTDTARHLSFFHSDGHCFGAQGLSNSTRSFTYFKRTDPDQSGNISEDYAITDSVSAQNAENIVWTDCVFVCGTALYWGDGGVYKRLNGTGNYSGNRFERFCVADWPFTGGEPVFGGDPAGKFGFLTNYTEEVLINNGTFLRLGNGIDGQSNGDMCLGAGSVTTPARGLLVGIPLKITNVRYVDLEGKVLYQREINYYQALKTIVSITKGVTTNVQVTGHGFPDVAQPTVYIEPEIYFDNMVGMTELQGNVYKAVWVDANNFTIKDLNGNDIDSTGFGTFTSGGCARAQVGYLNAANNELINADWSASDPIYKHANANRTLAQMQALASAVQQHLPGTTNAVYESGTVLNP